MDGAKRIIQLDEAGPKRSKKKKKSTLIVVIGVVALGGAILALLWFGAAPESVSIKDYQSHVVRAGSFTTTTEASGTVLLPVQVEIVSPQAGYSETLLVEEGDVVTSTDVLAIINVPDLDDEYNELSLSLTQSQISLEQIETETKFSLASLDRTLDRLEADIADAEEDAQTLKDLSSLTTSRESDYEEALDTLKALLEKKEDTLAEREETVSSAEISARKQKASITQYKANLAAVIEDLEECRIKSPIAGEVLSLNEDLAIKSSLIKQSTSLFVVADRSQVFIDFDVYEQYVGLLEEGGEMSVTIGTNSMPARITKIGKIATMDSDGLSAMITVRAEPETDIELTPGASAVASIILEERSDVLTLPRGSWLTTGNQEYAYVISEGKAVKTEVVLGEIQGTEVEILSGLNEDDEVITSSYQSFIDQNEVILK